MRRFLRENDENKRTFARLGSVAREIVVKDEENIVLFFALLCVVRMDWFIQKCGPYLLSKILARDVNVLVLKGGLSFSSLSLFTRSLLLLLDVLCKIRARCHCFGIKKWSSFFLSFSVYFSFSRALYYFFAVLLLLLLLLLLFVLLLIIIDADGCRRLMPLFNAGLVAIVAATASSSEAESAL